ncbi:FAD-dependent oxidoreductase [Methylicorpusculum oleiharenae]|uniref:NAD(P)/FAD-dependent oxidoreductase n=1 Tax=Methylicorpusculum oleiharenae TaxID=1338687 RepID=UPI001359CCCE|nr:FAD-dependent oxidoreductase [Methylicorpusculum oleiharenae]MCD2449431.1 FAD-dependent oxidoreductase [Methylicorpusculum oleiharenae]
MTKNKEHIVQPLKVVILGGGYAGLSALITLRKQSPDTVITLIDPRPHHLIITRLHETVHRPLDSIRIAYSELAKRFNFEHVQQSLSINESLLQHWQNEQIIKLESGELPFNYLIIAVGAANSGTENDDPDIFDLNKLTRQSAAQRLEQFIAEPSVEKPVINIVGAGPTGIQFVFEIDHILKQVHADYQLNIIDGHARLLKAFPRAVGDYVQKRLVEKNIKLFSNAFYSGIQSGVLILKDRQTDQPTELPKGLTFLFLGKAPDIMLHANSSGQVVLNKAVLTRIFTAGDCSHFDEMGTNGMTSQAALRKGRSVAKNLLLHAGLIRFCLPYMHQDIGYLMSLGPGDAVGWVARKATIISGLPAYVAKEGIELQYDLLLSGIDSYLP